MTTEKRSPGRPRKYKDDAERKRAYYHRKKDEIKKLEKRVEELEGELQTMSEVRSRRSPIMKELHEELTVPFMKLTPSEIAEMETEQLKRYRTLLYRNIGVFEYFTKILSPVRELMREPSEKEGAERSIYLDVTRQDRAVRLAEDLQQIVLIYLIEAELARRQREYSAIEKLEKRIEELERERKQRTISDTTTL